MLRSILFSIVFFLGIFFISIIFLPALLLPQNIVLKGGKLMGHWASFCLQTILSVKIKILGKENIINNEKFFIVSSHQSIVTWECNGMKTNQKTMLDMQEMI